ncbi:MAG TPA: hypothetical protein VJQ51_13990 [Burkholderiales bacterium]|nr:hypothetical protein [Burkholderiales bacterium]
MDKKPSFVFKTKEELEAMSSRERAIYFENMLSDFYYLQEECGELQRQHQARIALLKFRARVLGR